MHQGHHDRRADPSKVPMLAEPWSLSFNADVEFHIVMSLEDLGRADLDALGKKWASAPVGWSCQAPDCVYQKFSQRLLRE